MTTPDTPGLGDGADLSAATFRSLFEHSSDVVTVLDPEGGWRYTSPAGQQLLGWSAADVRGPDGVFAFVHPGDVETARAVFTDVLEGRRDPEEPLMLRVQSSDGRWLCLEVRVRDLTDDPDVHGIVVTARDVTERQWAEARIALLHRVLEQTTELVVLLDSDGAVIYANEVARETMGVKEGDAPFSAIDSFLDPGSVSLLNETVIPELGVDATWTGEFTLRTASGTALPVAITIQLHVDESGEHAFTSAIAHDISQLKLTQKELEHQATHDSLTGLANRALFQEFGEQALARSHRAGSTVAVLFLDLDRFKPVNDSLGHAAGDELLVQVAQRLRSSLRRGDVVARFGGDEFVVLCEPPAGHREMRELAERLITALSEPVNVMGWTATVGASVGIAIGGGGRVTIDTLIRDADAALYQAKELGRGRAVVFGELV